MIIVTSSSALIIFKFDVYTKSFAKLIRVTKV